MRAPRPLDQLTPRERAVIEQLAAGLDNKSVGRQLRISDATVRTHCLNIYRKLGIHSRTQAALTFLGASADTNGKPT